MKKFNLISLRTALLVLGLTFGTNITYAQQTATEAKTTAIGTQKTWGTVDGMQIIGLVQGPSAAEAELQIACVFEYTEGDIFNEPALPAALNGLVHLDEALKGNLTSIRKTGKFDGRALETFLISPDNKTLGSKKLLLIGLGDRNNFTPELMVQVGEIATREALKLGVKNFSFASDLKDAGIDSPTALVAGNVVKGIVSEYRVQNELKAQRLAKFKPLTKVYLLAGPAFFEVAGGGISDAIKEVP